MSATLGDVADLDANDVQVDFHFNHGTMAPKSKNRRILVRLVSTALTGFFYTTSRPRVLDKLAMMKYDPVIKKHVLFVESKIK